MQYAIVIENAESNFSAYVQDLPGCVATGHTIEETKNLIREAIEFHLQLFFGPHLLFVFQHGRINLCIRRDMEMCTRGKDKGYKRYH